jgi:hypothetical protein
VAAEVPLLSDPGILPVLRRHPLGPLLELFNITEQWRPFPGWRLAELGLSGARDALSGNEIHPGPDGNVWLLQEITARLPGRIDSDETSFASVTDLANALRRAAAAHGEHEVRTGQHDENWPDWYAYYMVAEQAGKELPL